MSLTRTFKPAGRPPKMPGGCYAQVCGYLADNTGSIVKIAKAISYSERSVETAITLLRKESSPLLARVVDGRFKLRTDADRPRPRKRVPKKEGPRLAGPIQDVAIANRSPLEAAWGLAMGVLG